MINTFYIRFQKIKNMTIARKKFMDVTIESKRWEKWGKNVEKRGIQRMSEKIEQTKK